LAICRGPCMQCVCQEIWTRQFHALQNLFHVILTLVFRARSYQNLLQLHNSGIFWLDSPPFVLNLITVGHVISHLVII
jgi:hypothetical protein